MSSCIVGFLLVYGSALLHTKHTAAFTNSLSGTTRNNGRLQKISAAADILPEIRDEITAREGQLQEWEESVQILSNLIENEEDAESKINKY